MVDDEAAGLEPSISKKQTCISQRSSWYYSAMQHKVIFQDYLL